MTDAIFSPDAVVPAPAAWRLPRPLSVQSVLVLLGIVVSLVALGSSLLADPDTQWHIAVGRQIWAARAVPHTDLYSYTFAGAPWIAKEWVSQLILFGAEAAAGWRGVVLVTALAVATTFAILHEYLQRRLRRTIALSVTLFALMLTMPHMLARPHMLVLPVIMIWMVGLLGAVERGRTPPLAAVLLMTLWANMHGSFPLGLGMAGLMAIEAIAAAPPSTRVTVGRGWALFLAAAAAATLISPYGLDAILVPLRMEGNAATLDYVTEWQPLHFDSLGCMALAALAACLAVLAPQWRRNLVRIVAVALLGAMMIRHIRFVSLFGVLAPVLVADALRRWPRLAAETEAPDRRTTHALLATACALAAAALAVFAIVSPAPAAKMTPEAAFRAAIAAGVQGPVYNDYDFGGFLIAHGVKTFVDGRTDQLFLGDFLPGLKRDLQSRDDTGFAARLARYGVTWALVRIASDETRHFATMKGWRPIHRDDVASVFVRER